MKTLGRSLVGAKKDRKRRSLVNTPDVLVTGDAADVARKSIHFSGRFRDPGMLENAMNY